jgi:hypothetical protein
MEVEIRPEPPEPVRDAIVAAIALAHAGEAEDPWWRAGLTDDD